MTAGTPPCIKDFIGSIVATSIIIIVIIIITTIMTTLVLHGLGKCPPIDFGDSLGGSAAFRGRSGAQSLRAEAFETVHRRRSHEPD